MESLAGDEQERLERLGFDERDAIWRAQGRPGCCSSVCLSLQMFTAVAPGATIFVAYACWALSFPLRMVGNQPFDEWPFLYQWTHIVDQGVMDVYTTLVIPSCMWILLGYPAPFLPNLLLSLAPVPYLVVVSFLGIYEPEHFLVHLPLNIVWVATLVTNAATFARDVGTSALEVVKLVLAVVSAVLVPVVTSNIMLYCVFPIYTSSNATFFHRGFMVNVVVPASFFVSQWTARQACLTFMGPGRHPGLVSGMLIFSLLQESIVRRALLCGVQDLQLVALSSFILGLQDTVMQLTVDLRDGIIYACTTWPSSRRDYSFFEHPGRRRLRASGLILHFICEHLAIFTLSGLVMGTQVFMLHQPRQNLLKTVLGLGIQVGTRFVFDVIVFSTEARLGSISRVLFRLERWHGIATREVWKAMRWRVTLFTVYVAVMLAGYCLLSFKRVFEKFLQESLQPGEPLAGTL